MSFKLARIAVAASLMLGASGAAVAAEGSAGSFEVKPLLDTRLRYENVEQPATDADALTFRARAGAEVTNGMFSVLAEGEGTLGLVKKYNAFPFPIDSSQRRPQYSVVADPESIEINRLQAAVKKDGMALTLGRQRINLDDQRWVGAVGWRQNEQTFDAVRGEAKVAGLSADLTYSISQRTIFGSDAGPRTAYDGNFLFAGLGGKTGAVEGKLFGYFLDYDESFFLANSSKTIGGFVKTDFKLTDATKLNLKASYARQSDMGKNPFDYAADYVALEAGSGFGPASIALGWEKLGSDNGRAVQTPMATLHKFNGWADLFLATPADGLEDLYGTVGFKLDKLTKLPGLNANLAYHRFTSDVGKAHYGNEFDASIGFKLKKKVGVLAKYANYSAKDFGVDTKKFWLQLEWSY